MTELNQKLGFDASAAITSLTQLATALTTTGAAMDRFATKARAAGGSGIEASMAKGKAAVDSATSSYLNMGKTAQKTTTLMQKMGAVGQRAGAGIGKAWQTALRIVGTQLITRALGSLAQGFGDAVESAREFRLAIAEVATISGSLGNNQEALASQVLRLSTALGQSAKVVAEGLYQTLSNQVVEAANAFGFLETAMKLAIATGSEAKDAVNALSSVINSYGLSAADAGRISDQLFKTVELGRLRLGEIGNVMGRVTPLTAKLGISFTEVAAAIAVQTRQGVQANTSLTQLRAVVQKLIKPTGRLREIFKKWGVADGPAAIKTFGGLEGVLSKLSKEVDGNDAEMAKFFNRVRAISAQMATMTDEGQRLRDAIEDIGDAQGATNKAFSEFEGSAAFELTKAQNQFNNELTKTGTALTRLATFWADLKTKNLIVIRELTDGLSSSFAAAQEKMAQWTAGGEKAIIESRKRITKNVTERLNEETQTTRQALAEINAIWTVAVDKAIGKSDQLKGKLTAAFKGMSEAFKASFSGLSDFVKSAGDSMDSALGKAQSLRGELADRRFDKSLEGTTPRQRANALLQKSTNELIQAQRALDAAITGPERQAADKGFAKARDTAERAAGVAQRNNLESIGKRAEALIEANIVRQIQGEEAFAQRVSERQDAAIQVEQKLTEMLAEREVINNRLIKLYTDFDKALDPTKQAELNKAINENLALLSELEIGPAEEALLDALGIPGVTAEFTQSIRESLETVNVDWSNLVESLSNALADVKIDLRGDVRGGQKLVNKAEGVLGRPQGALEGDAAFVTKSLDQQTAAAQKLENAQLALSDAQIRHHVSSVNLQTALGNLNATTSDMNHRFGSAGTELARVATFYQNLTARLQENKVVTEGHLDTVKKEAESYFEMRGATEQGKQALEDMDTTLRKTVGTLNSIDEQKEIISKAKVKEAAQNIGTMEKRAKGAATSMRSVGDSAQSAATGAGQLSTTTAQMPGVIAGVQGGWQSVEAAIRSATAAAIESIAKLKQAKAAAASAFHGGTIDHLAAGGPASRGQDTVNAMLSPGEFVVNSKATRGFFSELNAINNGAQPVFREQGGAVTNVGDVNVTVNGGDTSQQTVREIGGALRRELRRGTIKLS